MIKKLLLILSVALLAPAAFAADKPNVVYILVDNWGWGDIGVQGGTVPTPRIDALAAQGMRLTNFNVQNASIRTLQVILPITNEDEIKTLRASGDTVSDFVRTAPDSNIWEVQFKRLESTSWQM